VATYEGVTPSGEAYGVVWVTCSVAPSDAPDEVQVQIESDRYDDPLLFYVPRELVDAPESPREGKVVQGQVKVMVAAPIENGTWLVKVFGDPMSFGPLIQVPDAIVTSR
jgi:hypothetical protein